MSKGGETQRGWQGQSAQNSASTVMAKSVGSPFQFNTPTSTSGLSAQSIFGQQSQQPYSPTYNFSFDNWSPVGGPSWQETQDALNAPPPAPQPAPAPPPAPPEPTPPPRDLNAEYRAGLHIPTLGTLGGVGAPQSSPLAAAFGTQSGYTNADVAPWSNQNKAATQAYQAALGKYWDQHGF